MKGWLTSTRISLSILVRTLSLTATKHTQMKNKHEHIITEMCWHRMNTLTNLLKMLFWAPSLHKADRHPDPSTSAPKTPEDRTDHRSQIAFRFTWTNDSKHTNSLISTYMRTEYDGSCSHSFFEKRQMRDRVKLWGTLSTFGSTVSESRCKEAWHLSLE